MAHARPTRELLNGWPTRRFELLRTQACDLVLAVEDSAYAPVIARVQREMRRRGLPWFPQVYLSTGWHCPDKVPIIGVPFTLATPELRRIEKEVTGQLETADEMAQLLRHEVGHAYNYALRLHETSEWRQHFGAFSRPYRERYATRPRSRRYVQHLRNHYAQKHPDEDFAETFAVWLTPRARWRRRYQGWGALAKLEYVDRVMREHVGFEPSHVPRGPLVDPVDRMDSIVARHYQQQGYRLDEYGFEHGVVSYFDEDLREVFKGRRIGGSTPADQALRRLRRRIVDQVIQLIGVRKSAACQLYDKYVERAKELGIETAADAEPRLLVSVATMMTTHLVNHKHTGRFTRQQRLVKCR